MAEEEEYEEEEEEEDEEEEEEEEITSVLHSLQKTFCPSNLSSK